MQKVFVASLILFVALVEATPTYHHKGGYKETKKPYAFAYGVNDYYTGTNFGQKEESDGNTVKGSYSVDLPDGRTQVVKYTADHHNGFQAEVIYHGEATYPSGGKGYH